MLEVVFAREQARDQGRDDNGSGRAITRPPVKRLQVEICTRTYTCG
jgi:hypothetical protein